MGFLGYFRRLRAPARVTGAGAPENAKLPTALIVAKIKKTLTKVKCRAVLLCTDDKGKKDAIKEALLTEAIPCFTYDASLSDNNKSGLHFSDRVPKHTPTQDVVVEIMMMAKCAALLCTRSNMTFMVAVMAGEQFQVFDMWLRAKIQIYT